VDSIIPTADKFLLGPVIGISQSASQGKQRGWRDRGSASELVAPLELLLLLDGAEFLLAERARFAFAVKLVHLEQR
jgi:hypothetical protein